MTLKWPASDGIFKMSAYLLRVSLWQTLGPMQCNRLSAAEVLICLRKMDYDYEI